MYKGFANRALGREVKARSRFFKFISYGEKHYYDRAKIDYFAVSLPDLQLFDEDLSVRNRVHCEYLIALGRRHRQLRHTVLNIDCARVGNTLHKKLL